VHVLRGLVRRYTSTWSALTSFRVWKSMARASSVSTLRLSPQPDSSAPPRCGPLTLDGADCVGMWLCVGLWGVSLLWVPAVVAKVYRGVAGFLAPTKTD
jgi:hypothetical protein